jgi:hypothetical protein
MRRTVLLAAVFLLAPCLFPDPAAAGAPQQPVQNLLPDPAAFIPAGPQCQRRVNMSPWVGTPAVDWPTTYRCELTIHTCGGPRTTASSVRPGGTGMCADYWAVQQALANREICCDPGSREAPPPRAN